MSLRGGRRFHQRWSQVATPFAAGDCSRIGLTILGSSGGGDRVCDPISPIRLLGEAGMGRSHRKRSGGPPPDQQAKQGMEALLSAAEVADAQQLQRPLI